MGNRVGKRMLAALVMADVVGYARLMEADEDGTLARLRDYRTGCIEPTIRRHGGRIVDAVGDSMFFEFASAVDATAGAIDLQQRIAECNAAVPQDRRLMLRMGINIGDVILRDRALFGDSVNIAARLQALAEPGGICLSGAAFDQVRQRIEAEFSALGPCEVKNITRPIEVFSLSPEAVAKAPRTAEPNRRPLPMRRLAIAAGSAVLVCLVGVGAVFGWTYRHKTDLRSRLDAALSVNQAKLTDHSRAALIDRFLAIELHRAFALAPRAQDYWWTGNWPGADVAEEKVLERCQIRFGEPCSLAAVDNDMPPGATADKPETRDMPRLHYEGAFDPAQIPGVRPNVVQRADVAGYAGNATPKAAALHPHGAFAIVTGATSQRRAEIQALHACNQESNTDGNGGCLLYASGNKVVLPLRATAAISKP